MVCHSDVRLCALDLQAHAVAREFAHALVVKHADCDRIGHGGQFQDQKPCHLSASPAIFTILTTSASSTYRGSWSTDFPFTFTSS